MNPTVQINPAYFPMLYDYGHRYELYWGGRGSGKSVFVMQKITIKSLNQPRRVLFIRKHATELKETVFELALQTLSAFGIRHLCTINFSTYRIEFPNKSCWIFKGLDDPEKLKSITDISDIVIEEASQILDEMDIVSLDQGLRASVQNLQLFMCFNPPHKNHWLFKRYFAEGIQLPPNTYTLRTTYRDNLFLNPESKAAYEQLKETNPQEYRRLINGEWTSLDKLVFANWHVESFDYKAVQGITAIGLDFGYVNDATALVASKIDTAKKTIHVFDEHYQTGMLNNAIAHMIQSKGFSKETIVADSSEQKSIEEIKRLGISRIKPSVKGPGSVLQGLQLLQQYRLVIDPKCTNLIIELENYSWAKDRSGEYINEPVDAFNHCIDALRYSLQAIEKRPTFAAIPIPY